MINTTDNQNEVFDIVDEKDNVIGQATRGEVHRDRNLIHRSVGIFVFNQKGELYLQKRSRTKDTERGKWTVSASGHVNSGNDYLTTAIRELKEELGVDSVLQEVTKFLCLAPWETEICMLFKTVSDGPFTLHPQEIEEGKFFTQKELQAQAKSHQIELSFMGKMALRKISWI